MEKLKSKDFLGNNKFLKIFVISSLVLILIISAVFASVYLFYGGNLTKPKGVIAIVGGENIYEDAYNDAKAQCVTTAQYNEDPESEKECNTDTLNALILQKALQQEAKKQNIIVTSDEVNKEYQELSSTYESEEVFLDTYKGAFGKDPDDIKQSIETDLLKSKLEDYLIASRDVYGVYIRWDTETEKGVAIEVAKNTTTELINKYFVDPMGNNKTEEEIGAILTQFRTENPNWKDFAYAGDFKNTGVNAENEKDIYLGREDWQQISKLDSVGQTTVAFPSTGGYSSVYRLTKKTEGQFNSWEDYISFVKKEAKVYSYLNTQEKIAKLWQSNINKLSNVTAMLGINEVLAQCANTHFSGLKVKDTLVWGGGRIKDAKVEWSKSSGYSIPKCSGFSIPTSGNFTAKDESFMIGNDDNSDGKHWLSCYAMWDIEISRKGYYSIKWTERNVAPNGSNTNLDKPVSGSVNAEFYEWDGNSWNKKSVVRAENTDNDGKIKLRPVANRRPTPYHYGIGINGKTAAYKNAGTSTSPVVLPSDSNTVTVFGYHTDPDSYENNRLGKIKFRVRETGTSSWTETGWRPSDSSDWADVGDAYNRGATITSYMTLKKGTTYEWQVKARDKQNLDSKPEWTSSWYFKVDQPAASNVSCIINETGSNSIAAVTPITASFKAENFKSIDKWDFGAAGTEAGNTTVKKTFSDVGTYDVVVTGKDQAGTTKTAACKVTVYPNQSQQGNEVRP